jgi:RecB family endonuclease NucS
MENLKTKIDKTTNMNSKIKDVKVVVLSEEKIKDEVGFLAERMGQGAVSTYLIRHSEEIEEDLKLVGMEVDVFGKSFDMLFRKEDAYFVVEIKRRWYPTENWMEKIVQRYAEEFEKLLNLKGQKYQFIQPVLVVTK